jgi:hypothetical protein
MLVPGNGFRERALSNTTEAEMWERTAAAARAVGVDPPQGEEPPTSVADRWRDGALDRDAKTAKHGAQCWSHDAWRAKGQDLDEEEDGG